MNYLLAIKQLIQDIEKNADLELITKQVPEKKTSEKKIAREIGYINDAFEVDFSAYLNDTYDLFGCTHVCWQEKNGLSGGEINLMKLNDCFYKDFNLAVSARNAEKKKILENFFPFDDHPVSGDGLMSGFVIQSESKKIECWFYDNGDLFRMNIDLLSYLNFMIQLRGIYFWQYLFIEKPPDTLKANIKKRLKELYKVLEKNFPPDMNTIEKKILEKLKKEL